MQGQLTPTERKFLNDAVSERKPKLVLEIGTWKGGGSTWQIANALKQLGRGHLHTCETNPDFYKEAKSHYGKEWAKYITLHQTPSTTLIQNLIKENKVPDFCFFDGPNDAELNMSDFKLLEPHMKKGYRFCMHDWDLWTREGGVVPKKAKLIRPYIEESKDWTILGQLSSGQGSVGIVLASRN